MARLSFFPLDASEYLLDTKIRGLNKTERGILVDLWCWMWVNQVKRGHLLERVNGKIRALTDGEIAQMLQLTDSQWAETRQKLVEGVGVLKIGNRKELYSKRQSKYKTKYDLYGDYKGNSPERNRKPTGRKPDDNISKVNLNINKPPTPFSSTGKTEGEKKDCPHCGRKDMVIIKPEGQTFIPHECKR